MKQIGWAMVACVGLGSAPALAFDWSLSTTETQTFELNSNQFMNSPSLGPTLGSYTTLSANAAALTPTSKLTVDGNIGYTKWWGPGTDGVTQTESDRVGVNAHYETREKGPDDLEFIDGTYRQSSTLVAVLGDLGVPTNAHGDIEQSTIRGGIQRSLSALDTISFTGSAALTTYTPASGGVQFTDSSATAGWRHKIDPLTTLVVNSQLEFLAYDTVPSENLTLWRNTAGFETAFSSVLSYGANIGVIYTSAAIGSPPAFTNVAQLPTVASGSTTGFIGNAHALYRITKETTLNLVANQTIAPVITGQLTKTSSLHAGVTQTLNSRSNITVGGDVSQQTFGGVTNDFLSGSVSYGYQLARNWNATLTYRYLHRTASNGATLLDPITGLPLANTVAPADSNSLMVTVSNTQILKPPGD